MQTAKGIFIGSLPRLREYEHKISTSPLIVLYVLLTEWQLTAFKSIQILLLGRATSLPTSSPLPMFDGLLVNAKLLSGIYLVLARSHWQPTQRIQPPTSELGNLQRFFSDREHCNSNKQKDTHDSEQPLLANFLEREYWHRLKIFLLKEKAISNARRAKVTEKKFQVIMVAFPARKSFRTHVRATLFMFHMPIGHRFSIR